MPATFARLGLPETLVRALDNQGITEPFPVQAAAIPDALAGHDVCGKAPTGSGKTLAFGLPTLTRVGKAKRHKPRALILAPTRELAEQIKRDLAPLAKKVDRYVFAIYGGVGYGPQKAALQRGVDVLVATPGRLEDLVEQRSVDLSAVHIAVVDEADRMADMGFLPAVRRILDQTSPERQTLLFSATLDGDIAVLSRRYQHNPVRHDAPSVESEASDARHHFWLVQHADRVQHTAEVVDLAGRSIVFTRTRRGADRVAKQLNNLGVDAVALHGGRTQGQRSKALRAFTEGRAHALVATDVAARGIHIDSVESVIHFDPPADHKDYLHRSGRTARAGATGTVVSLVTGEQKRSVHRLQKDLRLDVPIGTPRMDDLHAGGHRLDPDRPSRNGHRADRPSSKHVPARRRQESSRPRSEDSHRTHEDRQSLYVSNLPWGATPQELEAMFGRYGKVHEITIITDKRSGRSKGFGFVDMPHKAAHSAVEGLNGRSMHGRDLTVKVARPRTY